MRYTSNDLYLITAYYEREEICYTSDDLSLIFAFYKRDEMHYTSRYLYILDFCIVREGGNRLYFP